MVKRLFLDLQIYIQFVFLILGVSMKLILRYLGFYLFVSILISCRSKDGDLNVFSIEEDVRLGQEFNASLVSESSNLVFINENLYPEPYKILRGIVSEILQSKSVLHRNEFAWELFIIQDDSVQNAFCTPGGYIYVYTGLIRHLKSKDEMAGVLGHEIAHADLRHSTEQLTKQNGLRLMISFFLGDHAFLGNLAGNLLSLSFSRSDEEEADLKSVDYLMDTPYDPRGVARFFERMDSGSDNPAALEFISTHPSPDNRVEAIYMHWKERGSKSGDRDSAGYEKLIRSLPS